MICVLRIIAFSCTITLLAGCNGTEKDVPIWEHVKISDLATAHTAEHPGSQSLKTINFDVYIFELPVENIGALDGIWRTLYTKPLRFNDYDAFCANSFSVGFGQLPIWNEIADLLRTAGAKKAETVTLLLSDGLANDIAIAGLADEQTIFYISTAGSMEGATVGPGTVALRIKAEKIPGARGVCNVHLVPVSLPLRKTSLTQANASIKSGEFHFTSAGFRLKMGPGDFFLFGPGKYINNQITLGGSLFNKPGRKPAVRVFMFICTGIND
ncbi:MAG: hypothetical protein DRP62_02005 [Planctomycetota bacterium]|nr:MAG: hypothetical protein DRP62_02005 [Planctomycetota bacterium]